VLELRNRLAVLAGRRRRRLRFHTEWAPNLERGRVIQFDATMDDVMPYPDPDTDGSWVGKRFAVVKVGQGMMPPTYATEIVAVSLDPIASVPVAPIAPTPGAVFVATKGGSLSDLFVNKLAGVDGSPAGSPFGGVRGVQVSTNTVAPGGFNQYEMVPDGGTGVVLAFLEGTASAAGRVIAQRLDAAGAKQWGSGGKTITSATQDAKSKGNIRVVSDGAGGWFVAWLESRAVTNTPEVYCQRLDSSGNALWTADGVQIATGVTGRTMLHLMADGVGGAWLSWIDSTTVKAMRTDGGGALRFVSPVTVRTGVTQPWGEMCTDAALGAFFITLAGGVVRLHRLNGTTGAAVFTEVIVSNASLLASYYGLMADGAGGCFVAWEQGAIASPRTWTDYAQRFGPTGAPQWTPSTGVPAGTGASTSLTPQASWRLESDAAGGIWIAKDNAANADILATRWAAGGVVAVQDLIITGVPGTDQLPQTSVDGLGGLIIMWQTDRLGSPVQYAQRVKSDNTVQWAANGVLVSGVNGDQSFTSGVEGASRIAVQPPS
jgi:hypothetical protein